MYNIRIIKNIKIIFNILKEFDSNFNPTISSLVGNLKQYSEKLYNNGITIALFDNNNIVGFASFYCNDNETQTAYLTQICIKSFYKSKGYGTYLLKKCEEISINNNIKKMRLEVYKSNEAAISFYKKNGYRIETSSKTSSVYMIKEL